VLRIVETSLLALEQLSCRLSRLQRLTINVPSWVESIGYLSKEELEDRDAPWYQASVAASEFVRNVQSHCPMLTSLHLLAPTDYTFLDSDAYACIGEMSQLRSLSLLSPLGPYRGEPGRHQWPYFESAISRLTGLERLDVQVFGAMEDLSWLSGLSKLTHFGFLPVLKPSETHDPKILNYLSTNVTSLLVYGHDYSFLEDLPSSPPRERFGVMVAPPRVWKALGPLSADSVRGLQFAGLGASMAASLASSLRHVRCLFLYASETQHLGGLGELECLEALNVQVFETVDLNPLRHRRLKLAVIDLHAASSNHDLAPCQEIISQCFVVKNTISDRIDDVWPSLEANPELRCVISERTPRSPWKPFLAPQEMYPAHLIVEALGLPEHCAYWLRWRRHPKMFLPPNRDPNWFIDVTIIPLIIKGTVSSTDDLEELARSHGVHANILLNEARHLCPYFLLFLVLMFTFFCRDASSVCME
jgi:hypothetical protein